MQEKKNVLKYNSSLIVVSDSFAQHHILERREKCGILKGLSVSYHLIGLETMFTSNDIDTV